MGFVTDGTHKSMARLISVAADAPGGTEKCFAIVDDDLHAHAEWRTVKEDAPAVSGGDLLRVEWDEAYSIGCGESTVIEYDRPPAGTYTLHIRPIDLLGQAAGPETLFSINLLAPWWQRAWVWSTAAAAMIVVVFLISRHFVHLRMAAQLAPAQRGTPPGK